MKAYQVKAIVKNSKPPIWRRIMIPAGITFSQLSMILNDIFQLKQGQAFQFEFYQRKLRIIEAENSIFRSGFYYDLQEASETFINHYLEEEKWFTYQQCSGDGQEIYGNYRVEIEAMVKMEPDYPVVIKWKDYVDEGTVTMENLLSLNRLLQEKYRITYEDEMVFMKQKALMKAFAEGCHGLVGMENPPYEEKYLKKSSHHMLKEFSDLIWQMADLSDGEKAQLKEMLKWDESKTTSLEKSAKGYCLKEVLRFVYSEKELRDRAKGLRLRGYDALSVASLAEKIANELLLPSVMKRTLGILSDDAIKVFETVLEKDGDFYPTDEQWDLLATVCDGDYVYACEDDSADIPTDVKELYLKVATPEFHGKRRMTFWLLQCLQVAKMLYGVAPVSVVMRMIRKKKGCRIEEEQLKDLMLQIPENENPCVLNDGRIMGKEIADNGVWRIIERDHGQRAFYIPSYEEIEDYYKNDYPAQDPFYQRLKYYFTSTFHFEEWSIEDLMIEVYQRLSCGQDTFEVMEFIDGEEEFYFPNERSAKECIRLLEDVNRNTRKVEFSGFTQKEIQASEPQNKERMIKLVDRQIPIKIASEPEQVQTSGRKIYPNDPCPCGSGKKYKKCCGKA